MNCLNEILDYYQNKGTLKSQATKTWISHILINLMGNLEEDNPKNYLKVRNCLILLINLFFNIEHPDHYHSVGTSVQKISNKERKEVIEILKSEFIHCN
jgi:hypothetical protein